MDKLAELGIFTEVVYRGDYSKASRFLNLTPSAVSKAIRRLETRLGARLFERTSRRMSLTKEGELLFTSARDAIASLEAAEAAISGSLTSRRGDLRVLAPTTFAIYQLARVAKEFRELYPQIRLEFLLSNERLDMAEHRIDVTIMTGRPPDSDLLSRKIASNRWILCASPAYLRERGVPRTLADLGQHDCLGYQLDSPRGVWSQRDLEPVASLPTHAPVAANNGSMLQALARTGCGIVRLAEYHVSSDLAHGRLVRVLPGETEEAEDVFAVYPRKLRDSGRLRVFIEFLQARFLDRNWQETALSGYNSDDFPVTGVVSLPATRA